MLYSDMTIKGEVKEIDLSWMGALQLPEFQAKQWKLFILRSVLIIYLGGLERIEVPIFNGLFFSIKKSNLFNK